MQSGSSGGGVDESVLGAGTDRRSGTAVADVQAVMAAKKVAFDLQSRAGMKPGEVL
jgi:hypothetical protein